MKEAESYNVGDIVRLLDFESTLAIVGDVDITSYYKGKARFEYSLKSVGVELPFEAWHEHNTLEVVDKAESVEIRVKRIEDKYNA